MVQGVFKNAKLEEKEITSDGEKLSDLNFADDFVALQVIKVWNIQLSIKLPRRKNKLMTNIDTTDNIQMDRTEIEKMTD